MKEIFESAGEPANEVKRLVDTISYIHTIRDTYKQMDDEWLARILDRVVPESFDRYVIEELGNDIVPAQHERMVLEPSVNAKQIDGITRVYLRIVTPHYERETDESRPDDERFTTQRTPQWDDVFVQLLGDEEQTLGKYLINADGIVPYRTVQPRPVVGESPSFEPEAADIVWAYGDFSLFKANPMVPESPMPQNHPLTLDTLKQLLNYTPNRQAKIN